MGPAGGKAKGCVYTLSEQADATPSARLRWSRSIGATSTRLGTGRAPRSTRCPAPQVPHARVGHDPGLSHWRLRSGRSVRKGCVQRGWAVRSTGAEASERSGCDRQVTSRPHDPGVHLGCGLRRSEMAAFGAPALGTFLLVGALSFLAAWRSARSRRILLPHARDAATRLAFQDYYQAPIPRTTVGIVRIRIER
jgi:hypothetical protein